MPPTAASPGCPRPTIVLLFSSFLDKDDSIVHFDENVESKEERSLLFRIFTRCFYAERLSTRQIIKALN